MTEPTDGGGSDPERDRAPAQETGRRRYRRWTENDAKRWKEAFESGKSILEIAAADEVDQKIVSQRLHRQGVEVYQGRHRVEQLPLKLSVELVELLRKGPDHVLKFLDERVWELGTTKTGTGQLGKFCEFVELHNQGTGVLDIVALTDTCKSTIQRWRDGTDQPYLVKMADAAVRAQAVSGYKILPLHVTSGGNELTGWIHVPTRISHHSDILEVLNQITPRPETYQLAAKFGLAETQVQSMRLELFAYLLGMMAGDLAKSGGKQRRFASTNWTSNSAKNTGAMKGSVNSSL